MNIELFLFSRLYWWSPILDFTCRLVSTRTHSSCHCVARQRSEKTLDRFLSFPLVSHPLQIHLDMIRAGFEAKKCLYFSFPLNGFGCPGCCHLVFGAQCWKDFDRKYFIQNNEIIRTNSQLHNILVNIVFNILHHYLLISYQRLSSPSALQWWETFIFSCT